MKETSYETRMKDSMEEIERTRRIHGDEDASQLYFMLRTRYNEENK